MLKDRMELFKMAAHNAGYPRALWALIQNALWFLVSIVLMVLALPVVLWMAAAELRSRRKR